MIKDKHSLDIEIDSLKGNINRMCLTDSKEELLSMYHWAQVRLSEILLFNENRLNGK